MLVKHLRDCREFLAGDGSILRELLHPDKAALNIRYSLAHATVGPGQKTKPHRLESCEVYYVLYGEGMMYIDRETFAVGSGCTVYIPPRAIQYIQNTGDSDLRFLCIVDPAWRQDDEEVVDRSNAEA
jgi:mannose-6-phosphate isomerase-like protein (cupin superfamily)